MFLTVLFATDPNCIVALICMQQGEYGISKDADALGKCIKCIRDKVVYIHRGIP
jgi:hypothetical protein